jgi:hypothetical protein
MSIIHRTPWAMVVRVSELRNRIIQEETPVVQSNDDIGALEPVVRHPRIRIFPRSYVRWLAHAGNWLPNNECAPGVKTNASMWESRLMNVRVCSQPIMRLQEPRMRTRYATNKFAIGQ